MMTSIPLALVRFSVSLDGRHIASPKPQRAGPGFEVIYPDTKARQLPAGNVEDLQAAAHRAARLNLDRLRAKEPEAEPLTIATQREVEERFALVLRSEFEMQADDLVAPGIWQNWVVSVL